MKHRLQAKNKKLQQQHSSEMDFSTRCRGCLSNNEESLRSPDDSVEALKLLQECVRLSINAQPNFPKKICISCHEKCLSWKQFQRQCLETDRLLNFNVYGEPENSQLDIENISEHKTDDVLSGKCLFNDKEYLVIHSRMEDQRNETPRYLEQEIEIEFEIEDNVQAKDCENKQILATFYSSENDEPTLPTRVSIENNTVEEVSVVQVKTTAHNSKNNELYCEQCMMRFRSSDRYQAHLRHHQGLKPEICKVCNGEFNTSRALRSHMLRHTDCKKYSCHDCGRTYKYSTSLTLHRKTHRDVPRFVCDLCGKSFVRAHGLKSHLISHSTETPFECSHCQKRFKNEIMLRNHVLRRHDGTKKFSCPDCAKCFTTGAELRIHSRSHTNQKPYKCSRCEKCYKTHSHLTVHFRAAHTTERPYACDLCELSFAHSKVLKQHRLTHTGERPWGCSVCKRTFRQNSTLQGHMKTHRRKSSEPVVA
ncbi:zinc finger protein 180-like isoform X2 [Wyeomyia smithii]|uniref:zinc finger protein 180-like isoform X2 n=1 Tax=Wyeomyia smithii TaxID=174621 RepID=UPI002467F8FC|nr:zinc finger protein 180-like isoform X2 [Wyeomyia smithii]